MIFSYWTKGKPPTEQSMPVDGIAEWRSRFPDYAVFSDEEVVPLLERWGADAVKIFEGIRIPACRSDVARLVLLHEYGGLYVDAHCAPGSSDHLALLFSRLSKYELIVFDESANMQEYRHTCIINGVLCARARAGTLDVLIRHAFANLGLHRDMESSSPDVRVDYSIYKLTGPWMIWHELFQNASVGAELRPEYRDCVSIWPYEAVASSRPVHTAQHYGYRTATSHWSHREKAERLFVSAGSDAAELGA